MPKLIYAASSDTRARNGALCSYTAISPSWNCAFPTLRRDSPLPWTGVTLSHVAGESPLEAIVGREAVGGDAAGAGALAEPGGEILFRARAASGGRPRKPLFQHQAAGIREAPVLVAL